MRRVRARLPFSVAALGGALAAACVAVLACGPAAAPSNHVVVSAPSASAKRVPTPCEVARDLRATFPALVREGRIDRVARSAKRADTLCPATESETAAARDAAIAELARGGDPDALFDEAVAARARGESAHAQTLNDRALAELERHDPAPAVAEVRRSGEARAWLDDAHVIVVAQDGGIYIAEVTTGRTWGPIAAGEVVHDIAPSRDGSTIATLANDYNDDHARFRAWDWRTGRALIESIAADGSGIVASPDGSTVAFQRVVQGDVVIALWDWSTKRVRLQLALPKVDPGSTVKSVVFSDDGARVAVTWSDGWIGIFDATSGATLVSLETENAGAIAFSPNGDWLAWRGAAAFGAIDVKARAPGVTVKRDDCLASAIGFDAGRRRLLAATYDRKVCILDLATKRVRVVVPRGPRPAPAPQARMPGAAGFLLAANANASPDEVGTSDDGTTIWMTAGWNILRVDARTGNVVSSGNVADEYRTAPHLGSTRDGAVDVTIDHLGRDVMRGIDSKTKKELWSFPWPLGMSVSGVISPDGERIAMTGSDRVIITMRTGTHVVVPGQSEPPHGNEQVMFDAATHAISFSMRDGSVLRFDGTTGALVDARASQGEYVQAHVVPRLFYTNRKDETVQLDLAAPPVKLEKSTGEMGGFALSPDGKTLAIAQDTKRAPPPRVHGIRMWDTTTGKVTQELAGHSNPLAWMVFSPDGKRLATATGGADPTIRIWDVATGAELLTLVGLEAYPASIAFSPDSGWLAASGTKGNIVVFDAVSGRVVQNIATPLERLRVFFGADGTTVIGASARRLVTWSVDGGRRIREVDSDRAATGERLVPGRDLIALDTDGVTLVGLFDGKPVISLRPLPGGAIAFARDGRVELLGDRAKARDALVCRVANRVFPFSLCEERLSEAHVVADALAPP